MLWIMICWQPGQPGQSGYIPRHIQSSKSKSGSMRESEHTD